MVIGIVAALTIPSMMQNMNNETLKKQKTVFAKKFEEGLQLMRVEDKLNTQYSSTEEFVDVMKRYFKITQVCNNDNLQNCFTSNFTAQAIYDNKVTNHTIFNTSLIKTMKSLVPNSTYNTNIVGIRLNDGTNMLLTYDNDCIGPESGETKGNIYKCLGYVIDVNNNKSPNIVGKDIITNLSLVKNFGLDFEIANNKLFFDSDISEYVKNDNKWDGAKEYCEKEHGAHLLTEAEALKMASVIYGQNITRNMITGNGLGDLEISESAAAQSLFSLISNHNPGCNTGWCYQIWTAEDYYSNYYGSRIAFNTTAMTMGWAGKEWNDLLVICVK